MKTRSSNFMSVVLKMAYWHRRNTAPVEVNVNFFKRTVQIEVPCWINKAGTVCHAQLTNKNIGTFFVRTDDSAWVESSKEQIDRNTLEEISRIRPKSKRLTVQSLTNSNNILKDALIQKGVSEDEINRLLAV
jgi:hypothetical protein